MGVVMSAKEMIKGDERWIVEERKDGASRAHLPRDAAPPASHAH